MGLPLIRSGLMALNAHRVLSALIATCIDRPHLLLNIQMHRQLQRVNQSATMTDALFELKAVFVCINYSEWLDSWDLVLQHYCFLPVPLVEDFKVMRQQKHRCRSTAVRGMNL